jgi:hypothetical protein
MQKRNGSQGEQELKPEEKALREKLLNDGDETNLDRSIARDGEFGGGFGEGHYTGTSWDPEINPQTERDTRARPQTDEQSHRAPTVHDDDYGSAGAGKFGGTKGPGLTTGGASPTTPR